MKAILSIPLVLLLALLSLSASAHENTVSRQFDPQSDLLLANFDSRPDVDDLHSVAALATILRSKPYDAIDYRAVAGAYGSQGGTYIDSPKLFDLAFGDRWVDAHNHRDRALATISEKVLAVLRAGGDVWVEEAGQSDFTADVLAVVRDKADSIETHKRFHVVQHSFWNESVTTEQKLQFVRNYSDYQKIPDGNGSGNGTPNYKYDGSEDWERVLADPAVGAIWKEAKRVADQYNGTTEYDNPAVEAGGFDFSDTVEAVWFLGVEDVDTVEAFFDRFLASP